MHKQLHDQNNYKLKVRKINCNNVTNVSVEQIDVLIWANK